VSAPAHAGSGKDHRDLGGPIAKFPRGIAVSGFRTGLAVLAALALGWSAAGAIADDKVIVIPLRVHVLTADDLPEVDCKLTDEDVRRVVGKVNGIWGAAGIHWGLESIVREPAGGQRRFRLVRDLEGQVPLGLFRVLRPEASRRFDGLHVYYVHRMPVNGVYMEEDFAIVQETARLRAVEGGIDEPIPRVTAHELGHALGLAHRQDTTNLLASGTTGTALNAREVADSRKAAARVAGAMTVDELRNAAAKAEAEGNAERGRLLQRWLAEIVEESRRQGPAFGVHRSRGLDAREAFF